MTAAGTAKAIAIFGISSLLKWKSEAIAKTAA